MRALRISLIVLAVLGVLSVVADRVAVHVAEGKVAARARSAMALPEEPTVAIRGFPFLTQVLNGTLRHVDVTATGFQAQVDGQAVPLDTLEVGLRDVELTDDYSGAVARRATGTGLISYDELTRTFGKLIGPHSNGFGVEFGYAGDERLKLTLQATVMGQTVDVGDVTGRVTLVDGQQITLEADHEDIPVDSDEVRGMIRQQLDVERTLTGLPDGMSLRNVTPTEEGLSLNVAGSGVDLAG